MLKIFVLFNILCAILLTFTTSQGVDFRNLYHNTAACQSGRLQSPINLMDYYSSYNSSINTAYDTYVPITNAQLAYNGRVLAVQQSTGALGNWGYIGFLRNGIMKQYQLIGIEVNYPGEHLIEGQQPDAEIKFIHQKVLGYQSLIDQFRKIPDSNNFLTISILYKKTATTTDNGLMADLLSTVSGYKTNNNFSFRSSFTLNVESYGVLRDRQFYFYDGSFTYTPCDETVNTIVYKDIFYISQDNLNFLSIFYSNYYTNGVTNKAIAQYFGRNVTRNYMNMTEAASSYHSLKSYAIFILIAILLF